MYLMLNLIFKDIYIEIKAKTYFCKYLTQKYLLHFTKFAIIFLINAVFLSLLLRNLRLTDTPFNINV